MVRTCRQLCLVLQHVVQLDPHLSQLLIAGCCVSCLPLVHRLPRDAKLLSKIILRHLPPTAFDEFRKLHLKIIDYIEINVNLLLTKVKRWFTFLFMDAKHPEVREMPNPFTFHNQPATVKEHQANANYWTYAKMEAIETLQEWEELHPKMQAPGELIANVHTSKWVEKEYIRKAQQARLVS